MTSPLILPDPSCSFGYPLGQVQELLGDESRYGDFLVWARSRRVPIGQCTSLQYRYSFEPSDCPSAPHGPIIYAADLHRYLEQAAA